MQHAEICTRVLNGILHEKPFLGHLFYTNYFQTVRTETSEDPQERIIQIDKTEIQIEKYSLKSVCAFFANSEFVYLHKIATKELNN
jgi:hypothetical protein